MSKCNLNIIPSCAPLVVDLDGTLTATDTLVESIFFLLKKNPLSLFSILYWLFAGRAEFKRRIASKSRISVANLPWREDFLNWLHVQQKSGRTLILATAAHRSVAQDAAHHIGLFSEVISTDDGCNLKGMAKLEEIKKRVGPRFSYAGDSVADLPIWQASESAILVGASNSLRRKVQEFGNIEIEFLAERTGPRLWIRALRVHQWLKNLLLFVPLLAAFAFNDGLKVSAVLVAFISFCLAASATYIFNDLWDLDSDRKHPRKQYRPFASARISILHGVAVAAALLLIAIALAFFVSVAFAGMLISYVALTTTYSWVLKHYVLIDVLMLALLYAFRVLAGAVAAEIPVTQWLLAFSVFMFFGLALVKRCAELKSLELTRKNAADGRDYNVQDLVVLWPLGIGASLCSVVIFGLYIGTPGATSAYGRPDLLWLAGIGLLYWNARLWIKTGRGEMHDDPIVFAAKDFGSRVTLLSMLSLVFIARFIG